MKKLVIIVALALLPTSALAQQQQHHRQNNVHPVAAPPSASVAHEENGKEQAEVEEEPAAPEWWTSNFLNNPRVSYGAMVINFLILIGIYYRFGKKPVAEALVDRKKAIASSIENAQKILSEAKQRSKKYKSKLEKVEADAQEAKASQVSTGKGDADAIVRNAQEKAARLARDVEFILDQEQKQTQLDLVRETVEKAAKEAETLLKSNVS
ncbi:MAG TPA: ATP synthase F0 subunit B, partial [Polyangiaceae bacterium]